jgi:hypothetical protein
LTIVTSHTIIKAKGQNKKVEPEWHMQTNEISKTELREIIKEAVTAVLTERKDLLEDALSEALLDMKLGLAMEEADSGEYVTEETIMSKLME